MRTAIPDFPLVAAHPDVVAVAEKLAAVQAKLAESEARSSAILASTAGSLDLKGAAAAVLEGGDVTGMAGGSAALQDELHRQRILREAVRAGELELRNVTGRVGAEVARNAL